MEMSGKSPLRAASTCPMLRETPVERGSVVISSRSVPRAPVEDQAELADLDLVTVLQPTLVHQLTVDVGAVQAAGVANDDPLRRPLEGGVPPGDGDVVEEDVGVGVPTDRR